MDSLILAIIILFLVVLPVLGLVFFIRSLISKKNIGCGIVGLLGFLLIVSIPTCIHYSTSYISDSKVIEHFEGFSGLPFPPSGKIIEKEYQEFLNFTGDMHIAFMIEVDTLTYNQFLQKRQKKDKNIEYRKTIEHHIAEIFDFDMDTLDYKKIVRDCWKLQDASPYRHIFDTLVSRKIITNYEVKHHILTGDEFSYFADERESTGLLKTQFPAEECAYTDGSWWFHKNKRIIVYHHYDY